MICERPVWELIKDAAAEPSFLNGGRNRRMVRARSATYGRAAANLPGRTVTATSAYHAAPPGRYRVGSLSLIEAVCSARGHHADWGLARSAGA